MENSCSYIKNKDCIYFPCHEGVEDFNCLFCYCPLYWLECPGKPEYFTKDNVRMKNCIGCTFPHKPENYEKVIAVLKKPKLAKQVLDHAVQVRMGEEGGK